MLFLESEPFISLNIWTSIFTLCNLLIVFFVMKKFLFKPVKKMIDDRQKEIDDQYADAEKSKTDAAELKSQYEARLAEANAESNRILTESLSDLLIKYQTIQSWNGELPKVSSGASPLVDVSELLE